MQTQLDTNEQWIPPALPQPAPHPGQQDVLPYAVGFLQRRQAYGIGKYGTPLRTHNGREALTDWLQEEADRYLYAVQYVLEYHAKQGALLALLDAFGVLFESVRNECPQEVAPLEEAWALITQTVEGMAHG